MKHYHFNGHHNHSDLYLNTGQFFFHSSLYVGFAWRALRQAVGWLEVRVSKARLRRGSLGVEYNGGSLSVSLVVRNR